TFLKKRGLTPFFLTPFFRAAARQDLCRSFVPNGRLFRYGAERRCACSETGYATRNAVRLLGEVSSHETRGAAATLVVSYRDLELFVAYARRLLGVGAIHLQRFAERGSKGVEQLVARAFLAIDARDFFNPADPPLTVLLYDGGVALVHAVTSKIDFTPANN
ncbi:MAG: hypothetical protein ACREVC_17080, partial [Burkholderiales bacterium]